MAEGRKALNAIVLAAGDGKRMKSRRPKVLHPAAGRPLLAHVLAALEPLPFAQRIVVTSVQRAEVEETMAANGFSEGVSYVVQDTPRGTADAARIAIEALGDVEGTVVIVSGDTPLLTSATLKSLIEAHHAHSAGATVLTARVADATGFGRILRGAGDSIERIVEERDANEMERAIDEVNASAYAFQAVRLRDVIGKVGCANHQGEYYLTDVISLLRSEGDLVMAHRTDESEVRGVNSRVQLMQVSALLRHKMCERWMLDGVTVIDPSTTYIDALVTIGQDAIVHPFTFLEGATSIGSGAEIGPQTRIVDSTIESNARVSFAVVLSSSVGPDATVGPFASLRPGTRLERGVHVGTFVETKKATLGEGAKVPHLSYLGDADIAARVNVGAGTITCNWDGVSKHQTVVDEDAYIGSDTMLVAPVHLGKRAATGAGAVVRGEVPDDALAVGIPARVIEGRGDRMGRGDGRDEEKPRQ